MQYHYPPRNLVKCLFKVSQINNNKNETIRII